MSIAAGDYAEALTITTPVTLQGAGAGEVSLTNPDPDNAPTVLIDAADGTVTIADIGFIDEDTTALQPVIHVATDRAATLSGITITGAPAAPSTVGVHADAGSVVTIEDATITGTGSGVLAGNSELGPDAAPAMVTINSSSIAANAVGVALVAGEATITGGSVSGSLGAGLIGYTADATFDVTGTSIIDSGDPTGGTFRGGVVIYQGGAFTGTAVTISGNDNGMMLPDGGDVTLTNSTMSDNASEGQDAGIWGRAGSTDGEPIPLTVTITGTEITGHAIGVHVEHGQTQISDSTIANNQAGVWALASSLEGSSLELTNSVVTDNDGGEAGDGTPGAGVYLEGSVDAVVTDTELSRNAIGLFAAYAHATVTGGVIADNDWAGVFAVEEPHAQQRTTVDLTGTSITGNGLDADLGSLFGFGGIALSFAASVTGSDLTIADNAGGVMVQGGSLSLTDSTISDSVRTNLDDLVGGRSPATAPS
ncbi:right-handed parallel beta-helix repeat-containing protein [Ruania alba]|uniref:right-handed parallel beta-helix repeat-containing protein n=1 Tax=Ruania alba TaxID=648782 RepID=UPI0011135A2B|nr:right-handed parallel beta-helix repeat-containing protein [Ruania alba]